MINCKLSTINFDFIKKRWNAVSTKSNKEDAIGSAGVMVFLVIAGLVALYLQTRPPVEDLPVLEAISMDKNIPEGYTLLPIEVTNYETLDSLIGNFSVVDIYSSPLDPQKKSKKIASRVKLLKIAESASHFAVLVRSENASNILSPPGPFRVSVRNPKFSSGTKFVKRRESPPKRVRYLME